MRRETRQEWGAKPATRIDRITSDRRGVVIHWPGADVSFRDLPHSQHQWFARVWQTAHMERHHPSFDIEYGSLICGCKDPFWMEARTRMSAHDWWVRVGSNGTTTANRHYTSVQLMLGKDELLTSRHKEALAEVIGTYRQHGWGDEVWPHNNFVGTDCPGGAIIAALPEIKRMADRWMETGVALSDKDVEKIANRVNLVGGDYNAKGEVRKGYLGHPEASADDPNPERLDVRLRQVERKIDRIDKDLDTYAETLHDVARDMANVEAKLDRIIDAMNKPVR